MLATDLNINWSRSLSLSLPSVPSSVSAGGASVGTICPLRSTSSLFTSVFKHAFSSFPFLSSLSSTNVASILTLTFIFLGSALYSSFSNHVIFSLRISILLLHVSTAFVYSVCIFFNLFFSVVITVCFNFGFLSNSSLV